MLTPYIGMGTVTAVENKSAEDLNQSEQAGNSPDAPQRSSRARSESSSRESSPSEGGYDEPSSERPPQDFSEDARSADYSQSRESAGDQGPDDLEEPPLRPQEGAPPPHRGPRPRGRRIMRDRRGRRRRDYSQPYPQDRSGGPDQGHGDRPERQEPPERGERSQEHQMAPHKIASLREIRAHIERVRQTLEGVLRDLNKISDQLTHAEHEKDVAEQEIENLKEQLRRLHR